ncbi:MFS transporter [Brevibacterium sp. 5221]|uniref:MFS transporter n=1 Tax=Brevibacterium rongguiense TaxID=2695267 RepID=A0A6N9H9A9_9MICO|nr:MFS transporter [Brevibacterium rongguiense]MYM20603.1 MFS transporter [Brevibacterium rongguiense]
MLSNYREIFALPGALRFTIAGLITRMPIAILGLGLVLFIQTVTGSYGTAGAVSATYMLVQAIANPFIAKQVDRRGQARVMVPLTVVHIVALCLLMLSVYLHLWLGLAFVFAGIAGATVGSVGALVRARWAAAAQDQHQLDSAFSWEAVADEILFVTGPVVVTALATAVLPPAGVIASIIAVGVGGALFYTQRGTEPAPEPKAPRAVRGKVLSNSGILLVVACELCFGVNFGALDVSAVAFADEQGLKPLAGVSLAAYAAGSLIAGAIYGSINWKVSVRRRYAATLVLLSLGNWMCQLAVGMVSLSLVLFVVGFMIAPSLIAGSSVIQELAPPKRLTEALAWIGTSMGFGVSIGSFVAGLIIDRHGAHAALLLPACATTLAAVLAVAFNGRFDPAIRSHAARQARSVIEP